MIDSGYCIRMLTLTAQTGIRDTVDWVLDRDGTMLWFTVSWEDLFEPGLVVTEMVAPDDVGTLEQALVDVAQATGDYTFGPALFLCRMLRCRPANSAYPTDPRLYTLFDAAGPSVASPAPPVVDHLAVASVPRGEQLRHADVKEPDTAGWPQLNPAAFSLESTAEAGE